INTMIRNVIENATKNGEVDFHSEVGSAVWELRDYLFKNVYLGSKAKEEESKAINIVKEMFEYYLSNPTKMPKEFISNIGKWGIDTVVCDYIAGMTDRYAISEYLNIFVPTPWGKIY
ncbi:MAG: deoxyguanosinetriphosphate triphosphohydrolase, partial [Clostridium sp.]